MLPPPPARRVRAPPESPVSQSHRNNVLSRALDFSARLDKALTDDGASRAPSEAAAASARASSIAAANARARERSLQAAGEDGADDDMPLEALVERPEDAAAKVSSAGTLVEDKLANEDEQGALDVRRMLDEAACASDDDDDRDLDDGGRAAVAALEDSSSARTTSHAAQKAAGDQFNFPWKKPTNPKVIAGSSEEKQPRAREDDFSSSDDDDDKPSRTACERGDDEARLFVPELWAPTAEEPTPATLGDHPFQPDVLAANDRTEPPGSPTGDGGREIALWDEGEEIAAVAADGSMMDDGVKNGASKRPEIKPETDSPPALSISSRPSRIATEQHTAVSPTSGRPGTAQGRDAAREAYAFAKENVDVSASAAVADRSSQGGASTDVPDGGVAPTSGPVVTAHSTKTAERRGAPSTKERRGLRSFRVPTGGASSLKSTGSVGGAALPSESAVAR